MGGLSLPSISSASSPSPAKQGKHQECIDVLFLPQTVLQNKQCFHNLFQMHTCLLRTTLSTAMPVVVLMDELSLVSIPRIKGVRLVLAGVEDTGGSGREDCS